MKKWSNSAIFRLFSKGVLNMPPFHVQIEPTTKCNLKCKFCIRDNYVNSDMKLMLFKSIIDQLRCYRPFTKTIDLTGVGEPLLCANIIRMVRYAKRYGFYVCFISNFSTINEAIILDLINGKLDYLYVSFDGVSKHTFEKLRSGACFEKVLENINLFLKIRDRLNQTTPKLLLRPTISSENIHELPKFFKLAEKLGVDGVSFGNLVTRTSYSYDWENKITEPQIKKARKRINICNLAKNFPPCITSCFITFDGKILPCGYLTQMIHRKHYSKFQMGDLTQNSFSEIWFGQRYKQFKKQIIQFSSHLECAAKSKCYNNN